ncbi:uncharacterized protein GJ701_001224 [Geothlypis trichas]
MSHPFCFVGADLMQGTGQLNFGSNKLDEPSSLLLVSSAEAPKDPKDYVRAFVKAGFPDSEQGGHEPSSGTWLKSGHRIAPNFTAVPAAPGQLLPIPSPSQFPGEPPALRRPRARPGGGLSPRSCPGPAARGSRHPFPTAPCALSSVTCRLFTSALRQLPPPAPLARRRHRGAPGAASRPGPPRERAPAAPARTSPSAAGTHRLLTGALPGPSRRLRARHSELPCAQRPLLSPAPLRVRRPLECPLQREPHGQPGLSLSSPGPPARARRCACRRLATPLFGGGADSCCRRRSVGPGGHSASAPPRPPAAPPAPGPARGPGLLPPSPPAVNNRRRQHKFRPPTRKLIGSRGPRGSDGKRIHRAVGGSGAGTGRSRPGRGAWAAGAAGGCGGQAAAGATEEGDPAGPVQVPSTQAYDPNPVYPSTCKETQGAGLSQLCIRVVLIPGKTLE